MRRDHHPTPRRAVLGALASSTLALAGCLGPDGGGGSAGSPTDEPSGTTTPVDAVGTYAWNGAPDMRRRNADYPHGAVGPYFVAAVRSSAEANAIRDAYLRDGASDELARAESFLTDTEYDRRSVIALQNASGSSRPNMELERITPAVLDDSRGLHVHVRYPGEGATADVIEDNFLVRVPGDPAFARATLTPQFGDPVTFATENALAASDLDRPRSLVVRNRDCTDHTVRLRGLLEGALATSASVESPAGSVRVADGVFPYAATYAIEASLTTPETTTSTAVSIDADDPRHVLVDVGGNADLRVARVDGTPAERRIRCDPEERPYESSDPTRNVADPVGLWVVSRDPDPRTLTVTIRDGDTRVFRRTFDLRGGAAKAREAGLLAKQTTYTLTVDPESGERIERSFAVSEGTSTVTVRVAETGEIEVVAN